MFVNRADAGRQLSRRVLEYGADQPVVMAMPRGGVPVAAEVAVALGAPLDIIVVRKLGCPWQPELGIGAIAEDGVRVLNEELMAEAGVSAAALEQVTSQERRELARRVARYRAGRPALPLLGRLAILVDDGLATGYTARAAVEALRRRGASRVVLAVPVAPAEALQSMRSVADEVIAVETPPGFFGIGEFYEDFRQTTDDEVVDLLGASEARRSTRWQAGCQQVMSAPTPGASRRAPGRRR